MSYASVSLKDVRSVKDAILEQIKHEPNLKFPCKGIRSTHEVPASSECGKIESKMMKLCHPCFEAYEAAVNSASESIPLVAISEIADDIVELDVEQGEQVEMEQSVLSRLATWVNKNKILTGVAMLGGVAFLSGIGGTAYACTKAFVKSNSSAGGEAHHSEPEPSLACGLSNIWLTGNVSKGSQVFLQKTGTIKTLFSPRFHESKYNLDCVFTSDKRIKEEIIFDAWARNGYNHDIPVRSLGTPLRENNLIKIDLLGRNVEQISYAECDKIVIAKSKPCQELKNVIGIEFREKDMPIFLQEDESAHSVLDPINNSV